MATGDVFSRLPDDAFESFADEVAAVLAPSGWTRRHLSNPVRATLVRPYGDGMLAVADLVMTGPRGRSPLTVELRTGAGYGPVVDLMALVALRPEALQAPAPGEGPEPDPAQRPPFTVPRGADRSVVCAEVAALIAEHTAGVAAAYPDVAAIDAAFEAALVAAGGDVAFPERIVLLAAAGRTADARAALDRMRDRGAHDRRFAHRMRRWLDTGGGPVPPAEETLATAPPDGPPLPPSPSPAEQRRRTRSRRQGLDAVRARAKGRSVAEVEEMIVAELAARGLNDPPSAVAWQANWLVREREPLGRLTTRVRGIGMLGSMVKGMVDGVRHLLEPGPAWLRPPDRAAFPLAVELDRVIAVPADDDAAAAVIARAHAASRRIGPRACVETWFTADGDAVAVNLGDHRVGTLRGADAGLFAAAIRAAADYDEAPYVQATITALPAGRPPLLEVPRPS
ncbi:MAG TPA: hypothetical protein VKB69_02425 [Micromonosporaceae bacterium]|nr:hypothetical protein [Micromonosporaceae bacterium]